MYGLDYLGGAKYKDVILREHPAGWAAGFFANTFGDAWPTIDALLATGRCPRVRIHAVYEGGAHTYVPSKHDPIIIREAQNAVHLQGKYKNVEVQFSPFCEHNMTKAQLKALVKKVKPLLPAEITWVSSVWKGASLKWMIKEVHLTDKKQKGRYNFSFDGLACVDADVEKFKANHAKAETFYFWVPQFNGRVSTAPSAAIPIEDRQAWPTSELIDSVIYLKNDRGPAKLSDAHIWKSCAEQHDIPPEQRALKCLLIAVPNGPRAELVADNGQVIAASGAPEPYVDGRWRYYFNQFGYMLSEKAIRIQGHPIVKVRINGKILGTVNPAFRGGSFRN